MVLREIWSESAQRERRADMISRMVAKRKKEEKKQKSQGKNKGKAFFGFFRKDKNKANDAEQYKAGFHGERILHGDDNSLDVKDSISHDSTMNTGDETKSSDDNTFNSDPASSNDRAHVQVTQLSASDTTNSTIRSSGQSRKQMQSGLVTIQEVHDNELLWATRSENSRFGDFNGQQAVVEEREHTDSRRRRPEYSEQRQVFPSGKSKRNDGAVSQKRPGKRGKSLGDITVQSHVGLNVMKTPKAKGASDITKDIFRSANGETFHGRLSPFHSKKDEVCLYNDENAFVYLSAPTDTPKTQRSERTVSALNKSASSPFVFESAGTEPRKEPAGSGHKLYGLAAVQEDANENYAITAIKRQQEQQTTRLSHDSRIGTYLLFDANTSSNDSFTTASHERNGTENTHDLSEKVEHEVFSRQEQTDRNLVSDEAKTPLDYGKSQASAQQQLRDSHKDPVGQEQTYLSQYQATRRSKQVLPVAPRVKQRIESPDPTGDAASIGRPGKTRHQAAPAAVLGSPRQGKLGDPVGSEGKEVYVPYANPFEKFKGPATRGVKTKPVLEPSATRLLLDASDDRPVKTSESFLMQVSTNEAKRKGNTPVLEPTAAISRHLPIGRKPPISNSEITFEGGRHIEPPSSFVHSTRRQEPLTPDSEKWLASEGFDAESNGINESIFSASQPKSERKPVEKLEEPLVTHRTPVQWMKEPKQVRRKDISTTSHKSEKYPTSEIATPRYNTIQDPMDFASFPTTPCSSVSAFKDNIMSHLSDTSQCQSTMGEMYEEDGLLPKFMKTYSDPRMDKVAYPIYHNSETGQAMIGFKPAHELLNLTGEESLAELHTSRKNIGRKISNGVTSRPKQELDHDEESSKTGSYWEQAMKKKLDTETFAAYLVNAAGKFDRSLETLNKLISDTQTKLPQNEMPASKSSHFDQIDETAQSKNVDQGTEMTQARSNVIRNETLTSDLKEEEQSAGEVEFPGDIFEDVGEIKKLLRDLQDRAKYKFEVNIETVESASSDGQRAQEEAKTKADPTSLQRRPSLITSQRSHDDKDDQSVEFGRRSLITSQRSQDDDDDDLQSVDLAIVPSTSEEILQDLSGELLQRQSPAARSIVDDLLQSESPKSGSGGSLEDSLSSSARRLPNELSVDTGSLSGTSEERLVKEMRRREQSGLIAGLSTTAPNGSRVSWAAHQEDSLIENSTTPQSRVSWTGLDEVKVYDRNHTPRKSVRATTSHMSPNLFLKQNNSSYFTMENLMEDPPAASGGNDEANNNNTNNNNRSNNDDELMRSMNSSAYNDASERGNEYWDNIAGLRGIGSFDSMGQRGPKSSAGVSAVHPPQPDGGYYYEHVATIQHNASEETVRQNNLNVPRPEAKQLPDWVGAAHEKAHLQPMLSSDSEDEEGIGYIAQFEQVLEKACNLFFFPDQLCR